MKIWKLIYLDEMINEYQVFKQVELIPEEKLNDRLCEAVQNGQLLDDTIADYKLDEIDLYKLEPEKIAEIFEKDGYNIESVEV